MDVKNPKLYKKLKRYYVNEGVEFTEEDPEVDYNIIVECIDEDLKEYDNPETLGNV